MDTVTIVLMAFFALLFLGGLLMMLVQKYNAFRRELDYVNMEIDRNDGKQKKYWQRKRRRLWLSWLPFYQTVRNWKRRK